MSELVATWNPARGAWETEQTSIICGHSMLYSRTFPISGSMRNGRVYERPMSVPLMGGSVSSWLPTPAAYDSTRGGVQSPDKRREGGHQPSLADVVTPL